MKKRLISIALVLVLVAAVALPVAAASGRYPLNGATVDAYLFRGGNLATASTNISPSGGVVRSSVSHTYMVGPLGPPDTISVAGPMDFRESHVSVSVPGASQSATSSHFAEYGGVGTAWVLHA